MSKPLQVTPEATSIDIPPEWQAELDLLTPESPEFKEYLGVLTELGIETPEPPEDSLGAPPAGFSEWHYTGEQSVIPVAQFVGKVITLGTPTNAEKIPKGEIHTDVLEMTSDVGNVLRICDLRSEMTGTLQKLAPRTPSEQEKLDAAFYGDLKAYADSGQIRYVVTRRDKVRGVYYARAGGTSMRAYWTLVNDLNNPDGVRTIGRLGDSGNNKGFETKLYHRLFGIVSRNI